MTLQICQISMDDVTELGEQKFATPCLFVMMTMDAATAEYQVRHRYQSHSALEKEKKTLILKH